MPTQPAILGTARLGNFRLGYRPPALAAIRRTRARILIGGVDARSRTRMAGLTVTDIINDAPNTCQLTVDTTEPTVQQAVRVSVNSDAPVLLFDGTLQTVGKSYEGRKAQQVFPCTAIDDGARAKRRRPFGTWTNVSATTIAQSLVALFMPGFTTHHVQAGLPLISLNLDGSEGIDGAFTQIVKLIGGYYYVEDLDLYLFNDPTAIGLVPPDAIDDTPGRFLDNPPIKVVTDDSQLVTRYYGKGHGEQMLADVLAGETILPVSNAAAWFGTLGAGGKAISDTQRLAYAGVQAGGGGSLVGPGVAPSVAPTVVPASGAGLTTGVYQYAYTDVTAAGESLPSPLGAVSVGALVPDPTAVIGPTGVPLFSYTNGGTGPPYPFASGDNPRLWAFTFVTAAGETLPSPVFAGHLIALSGGGPFYAVLAGLPIGPGGVTGRKIYRTVAGGAQLKFVASIDNVVTQFDDHITDGALGANAPTVNTAIAGNQVAISGVALGPATVTSRKIYRTAVNGAQLKLQQTIANNTVTVGVQDATADGSLGANAPTGDTSGLAQPTGQVNAGSTSLLLAGAGAGSVTGGWAILGNGTLVVRYTGITGNTLTGIPPAGPGSIGASVAYNSTVTFAPALVGVTGVTVPILKGAPVNIWVQRDDLAAQAAAAARDADGGDGVYEAPPIVDERRGEASLNALCDANLLLFSTPLLTVTHACRDLKAKSGTPQVYNLTTPPIHATLTIQEVQITEIDIVPGLAPRFTVTASSVRFSLESLLQKMAANL